MGTYGVFYFLYGMIFCLILILFLEAVSYTHLTLPTIA